MARHRATGGPQTDLDRVVDRFYRSKPYEDDAEQMAMLLKMYQRLTQSA